MPASAAKTLFLAFALLASAAVAAPQADLVLRYDAPATEWERQGLPIGNGAMGAMVMGGVAVDDIQFNEKTLWTGGPRAKGGYNGGLPPEGWTARLKAVRESLAKTGRMEPEDTAKILGHDEQGQGAYQDFGSLVLTFPGLPDAAKDYRRSLDLAEGAATVSFAADGVQYRRSYFASWPDHVIVVRLSADKKGKIAFAARFKLPANRSAIATAKGGRLTVAGALADNGEKFEAQVRILTVGGRIIDEDGAVRIEGADEAVLILNAGTDYAPRYPDYLGADPHAGVTARVDAASAKSYAALWAAHEKDYTALFDRVRLDLRQHMPDAPTNSMLDGYGKTNDPATDRALEALFFQYGRYLLIASSRAGSLPANLQGVWNNSITPPWEDDYHVNINIQMNYWPADPANLAETALPFYDFVDSLIKPGEAAAKRILGARGWTLFLKTNIWGQSGIISWPTAFWQPEAGAWLASQYYDHYRFSLDKRFLARRAWPVMKGAAEVWLDALVTDPADGKLVVSPSYSPEHGPFSNGAAMSQQVVAGLFEDVDEAAKVMKDGAFDKQVRAALTKLDPGTKIGSWRQLQEWKQDWDDRADKHRHTSHLYALHPGAQLSPLTTPALVEAAKVSLMARGDSSIADGEAGTGWSKAWKINFWARLFDGDRAHAFLKRLIDENAMDNLWDAYVTQTFQIDGNFGATAGVCEMLLQSHMGSVHVLPALPTAWPDGEVQGLRARGDVTVDIAWAGGKARKVVLVAGHDGRISIRSTIFAGRFSIVDAGSGKVVPVAGTGMRRTINALHGQRYVVTAL